MCLLRMACSAVGEAFWRILFRFVRLLFRICHFLLSKPSKNTVRLYDSAAWWSRAGFRGMPPKGESNCEETSFHMEQLNFPEYPDLHSA